MAEIVKDLDFWRFAAMGQFIKTVLWGKEATMYSYNGTVLPKLPEWDKTKYPYAVIHSYKGNFFFAASSGKGAIERYNPFGFRATGADVRYTLTDGAWLVSEGTGTLAFAIESTQSYPDHNVIVWSNYDIFYSNDLPVQEAGTILISATDPVPVYE